MGMYIRPRGQMRPERRRKNEMEVLMRKLLLLPVLLLSVSWLAAQDSPSSTQKDSSQTSAGSQTTVEGCLSGSEGKYTLTDKQGNSYQLTGDTSKLSDHVGHEVKITGMTSGAASDSGGAMGGSSSQSLEVSSMKHVSKTCKNSGAGMSK
jgi:hypothetical protein